MYALCILLESILNEKRKSSENILFLIEEQDIFSTRKFERQLMLQEKQYI
jgi:hypothetical protein